MTLLGPSSFKKAIEEAEKLSGSLKLRFGHLLFILFNCLPRLKYLVSFFCYFSSF